MITTLIASLLISVLLTGPTILLARYFCISDEPSSRNWHAESTPLMGGVPIFIAFIAGLLIAGIETSYILLFGIPMAVAGCAGLLDDIYSFKPVVKLLGLFPAAIVAFFLWPEPISVVFLVPFILFFMYVVNVVNLLDNIDGITGAMSAVSAAAIAAMAHMGGMNDLTLAGVALCGAAIGFLFFNYRPSSSAAIFLGDMGAFVLGAGLVIECALLMTSAETPVDYIACALPVGLVMFDTITTVITRKKKGDRALSRSLDHISQRLYLSGIARWKVTILMAAITALASLAGVGAWVAEDLWLEISGVAGGTLAIFALAAYAYSLRPDEAS